jgi:hypothetical protein
MWRYKKLSGTLSAKPIWKQRLYSKYRIAVRPL